LSLTSLSTDVLGVLTLELTPHPARDGR